MPKVTVEIPAGEYCMNGTKPCIFARFTKKMGGYNCKIYHKVVKGGETPRKCWECIEQNGIGAEVKNGGAET